jgi:hypothetical protein
VIFQKIKELAKISIRPVRRLSLAISTLITGHQHQLFTYLWSVQKKLERNSNFRKRGWQKFQLMSHESYNILKNIIDAEIRAKGIQKTTSEKWALNKRVNLDCSVASVAKPISEILKSHIFKSTVADIFGTPYNVTNIQIWRNYPEDYTIQGKEVNSTYYHVDNGGRMKERRSLNIFCYLSTVEKSNGPFTFYTPEQSKRINRHFISNIFRYGNLRTRQLVDQIEALDTPQQLFLNPGEAVIIDNQICLHRAGFCTEGHRDIMEIIVEPAIQNIEFTGTRSS